MNRAPHDLPFGARPRVYSAHLQIGPNFDEAARPDRHTRGPIKRRVEIGSLDDVKSAELLFGFGVRSVLYMPLTPAQFHDGGLVRRLQPGTANENPGLLKRLC